MAREKVLIIEALVDLDAEAPSQEVTEALVEACADILGADFDTVTFHYEEV